AFRARCLPQWNPVHLFEQEPFAVNAQACGIAESCIRQQLVGDELTVRVDHPCGSARGQFGSGETLTKQLEVRSVPERHRQLVDPVARRVCEGRAAHIHDGASENVSKRRRFDHAHTLLSSLDRTLSESKYCSAIALAACACREGSRLSSSTASTALSRFENVRRPSPTGRYSENPVSCMTTGRPDAR